MMRTLLLIAFFLLASCALQEAPEQAEVLEQALPGKTAIPNAWVSGADSSVVQDDWLLQFNDPSLNGIVAEALAYNLDLRQAAQRVFIAQQNVRVVGSQLLPQVGVTAGAKVLRDHDDDSNYDSNLVYASVGWELDIWGRLRSQRAASEAAYEATALEYAYARQSLAALVTKSWYLVIETSQLAELADRSVQVFENLLGLAKMRRISGKDSDLNIAEIQARLSEAQSTKAQAYQAYSVARRSLELLLGRYPAAEIEAAANFPQLPAPAAAGVPATLLERRPDLVAAQRKVLAAFRQSEAAKLARLPDFSILLAGGRLGDNVLSLLNLNPWVATAEAGMSLPIYEGGALKANIEIATAQQAQAIANYGGVVLEAFYEVENALSNDRSLAERLAYNQAAVENRTSAVEIATKQYLAGSRDMLWVSQLQTEQLASEVALIKVRSNQGTNRIRLYLALGGSFDTEPAALIKPQPPATDEETTAAES